MRCEPRVHAGVEWPSELQGESVRRFALPTSLSRKCHRYQGIGLAFGALLRPGWTERVRLANL